ncbi:MAG: AraC family transcriptional regulator [Lachnospiraceae bacterium]|nr:AraC family transcriptional regulator [Lachnospiraceae bacterium]
MEKQLPDFQERTSHGDTLLPVGYYHCHIPESYRSLPLHWHEEAELTYIEKGQVNYTINFETFSVKKGDLLFLSPHVLHGVSEQPECTLTSHSLVFHLSFLGSQTPDICTVKYLNPILNGKRHFAPVVHPEHPGYQRLKKLLLNACGTFQKEAPGYELRTKSLLLELLADLYAYGCVEKPKKENSNLQTEEKLKEILTYIQENYQENLSIKELAKYSHFSETYFMSFFRKYTGTTCIEYINRYRLSKAASALNTTDTPVMDIALENGFRNISYFNKLFRKRFGSTPGEYRRAARKTV